jgi:hypothetical protein
MWNIFKKKEKVKVVTKKRKTTSEVLEDYITAKDYSRAIKVIHITPNNKGYEIVKLHANRIARSNSFALIEVKGNFCYSGGLFLENTKAMRDFLNVIPKEDQYKLVKSFKDTPWARGYLDESYLN